MALSSALGSAGAVPVGVVNPFAGATAPSGWMLCYGQAVSRTTYSALFACLGTTYGAGDASTTFNVPDMRGRAVAGKDDMGGTAASRITNGVAGITATTLGATGGDQLLATHTHTNTVANNAVTTGTGSAHAHSNTASFSGNAASHSHTIRNPSTGNQILYMGNGASGYPDQWGQGGQGGLGSGTPIDNTSITPSGSVTISNASESAHTHPVTSNVAITNASAGTGSSANVPPTIILNYIIKAQ